MRKKIVGILVIILVLSVAFAPGITASREIVETNELNSDLVEVTVEVGNRDYSVLLTPDQALELENLIARTKTRLDTVTTWEETAQIFDDTVVSLYELGMLPKDISIMEGQQLVKIHHHISKLAKILLRKDISNLVMLDDEENRLCLIAGHTDNNMIAGPIIAMIANINPYLVLFLGPLYFIMMYFYSINPLAIGYSLTYGYLFHVFMNRTWVPSSGWIRTNGLNGVKKWDGEFYGNISGGLTGVRGFTGIKIKTSLDHGSFAEYFYLGVARRVKMRYETLGV